MFTSQKFPNRSIVSVGGLDRMKLCWPLVHIHTKTNGYVDVSSCRLPVGSSFALTPPRPFSPVLTSLKFKGA